MKIIKVESPLKKDIIGIRILIVLGLLTLVSFVNWFLNNTGKGNPYLYWPLTIAMFYKLLRMIHEWYHYFGVSVPKAPEEKKQYKVDMLTTYCAGEPKSMVKETLLAMKAVKYPHTTYLCDEANDFELKQFCWANHIVHVTRTEKKDAKAGNINNALKQATGELCVVMDPDHIPVPEFLDRTIPYFKDPKVGYVQCVQGYYNQRESLVAMGAAEQTYHFYGPMMMSMGTYGTAQAIGANCTFRREALDSIGGHAAGLSEDMHTAMRIHAKGWKSVYIPEMLSKGLVPGTLPSFYKQQLKWSRGTFELLFEVYPRLFRNFTWRQKLHYATLPLHYLTGLFTLIDILIPILALITAEAAWKIDIARFSLYFLPLFIISLLIRQFSQRWLLEDHERGFHGLGGLLRIGTWWVYIIGFFYSIIRKKVPYIPTPKDDKPQNNFTLALPNIIACIASLCAGIYGISNDYSEFSFFMASFAFVNCLLFGFISVISQEAWVKSLYDNYYARVLSLRLAYNYIRRNIYRLIRKGAVSLATVGTLTLVVYFATYKKETLDFMKLPVIKNTGGFYAGIYIPESDLKRTLKPVNELEQKLNHQFSVVSLYEAWGPESLYEFPDEYMREIARKGAIPMITWEPWSSTFSDFWNDPDLSVDRKVCRAIYDGKFDKYITMYAKKIREYKDPVFIRFAHEADNPAYPWSPRGGNTSGEFVAAWRHVVNIFEKLGVNNVSWVWNPWSPESIPYYFPGSKYVDWVGLTCLNYGEASYEGQWKSFEEIYLPYKKQLFKLYKQDMANLYKPIMLAEFGSTPYGGNQKAWLSDAIGKIQTKHKEIKAAILFNSNIDSNWVTGWRPTQDKYINWTIENNYESLSLVKAKLSEEPFSQKPLQNYFAGAQGLRNNEMSPYTRTPSNCKAIVKEKGKFKLLVDGKPFYIKGVAYNPGHDWKDGNFPLPKKQILEDFQKIKEMGANTIRRYSPTIHDLNILRAADETGLKVLYGFWFDPDVDYYRDSVKVNEYINKVEAGILKYKHHPSIMAWSVGNETWGLLKHRHSEPYLTQVRISYLKMLEHMARLIHKIDPQRPVFSSMEHEEYKIASEIGAFRDWAPSIDVIGINSYYFAQISKLNKIYTSLDSTRPYIISEFGPRGYWKPEYSNVRDTLVFEDSDKEKARYYVTQWKEYVEKHKGHNIGGVAYCWRDRFEGSVTWFGLEDMKNRLKPSYFALKDAWTSDKPFKEPLAVYIISPEKKIITNEKNVYHVYSNKPIPANYKCEWYLSREDRLEYLKGLEPSEDGRNVVLKVPEPNVSYRLYLVVSDQSGRVYTASTIFSALER